ncbi:MAG: hypothetical protein FJ265_20010, partial [Planctomycetes bacterium]|nr:hypothetical protein [Planctomycetota bacterium]
MNQPNEYSPAERDRLEQELLELHFGCHEDPGALQARLAAEPALRALQQEVLRKAQLLEEAARPEQPALDLKLPASGAESQRPKWPWRVLRSPVGRILAAASLAAVTVLGAFVAERIANWRLASHRAERLHVTVSAPQAVPVGAPWSFTVQANDLDGRPTACRVRWQAFGQRDAVLAANEVALHDGKTTVAMPATDQVPQRLEVVATHATDEVQQVLPLLAGVAGPLVHVTTDRPVYRPGEPVFARAVVLDRVTLQPLSLPSATAMQARLLDPKGAQVAIAGNMPSAGAGGFWLAIPPTSAGGEHRLEVSSPDGSFAPESIALVVRPFQNPQLKKTIVLDRATYAPGARGSAAVTAERMGGGMAAGAAVRGALVLDGSEVWNETQPLDGEGKVQFRFAVPAEVKGGSARFVATITDGGIVETEVRPFVVPTGRVLVAAFPEGGDLVAGVENQVYLECTDPLGRYVDTSGVVVDDRGEVLAKFRSTHQGRVKLAFVPRAGRSYSVHLAGKPAAEAQALPAVAQTGIAMQLLGDEVEANAPLRLQLAGRGDGPWLLGVFCRGALVGQEALRADSGGELRAVAEVPLPASAAGVLRATLFDRKMQPVAERLLRRASAQRVQVELACAHEALTPGDSQQVTVRTRDEAGQPLAAMVGLSVTDLAAASMGSEPRIGLADHASLFADVERTENLGDFLLGNPEGARNADLLLGTRGWRKFVWRNDAPAQAAIAAHGPFAANLLAREGVARPPQAVSNLQAANAAGAVLREARWHSEQLLSNVLRGVLVVLLVWVLVEVLIANVRRARRGSPLPLLATAGTIVAAAAFMVTTTMMVGESKHAVPAAMARDFEVEVARGAAVHYAISGANVEEPVGADDWFLHANAAKVDPAANPLAGAFCNVGVDG